LRSRTLTVKKLNSTVKLSINIMEVMSIIPAPKSLYLSFMESHKNALFKNPLKKLATKFMAVNPKRETNPITAATIWFSVRDDAKTPTDTKTAPYSIKPRYEHKIRGTSGFPVIIRIIGKISENAVITRNTQKAARNLPATISVMRAGDVRRSTSVPFFFSSATDFMVRMGTKNIRRKLIVPTKSPIKSELPVARPSLKKRANMNIKRPITT